MSNTGRHVQEARVRGEDDRLTDNDAASNTLSPHHPMTPLPKRIEHAALPIVPSPSGLPSQHLVSGRDGAEGLFVGQQWLRPGERVLLHTHPVEEAITFLSGAGEATLGEETVPIGEGVSLYIPAGVVHGFRCTAGTLHVMIVFPIPEFAETTLVERVAGEKAVSRIIIGAWFPRPLKRTDLIGVAPLDNTSLNELIAELTLQLPDYEIVRDGHAMAGMYGPPEEALRWLIDVQVPWDDLVGPAARVVLEVMREVFTNQIRRRREMPSSGPSDPPMPEVPIEEAVKSIPIYGPNGKVLSRVDVGNERAWDLRP